MLLIVTNSGFHTFTPGLGIDEDKFLNFLGSLLTFNALQSVTEIIIVNFDELTSIHENFVENFIFTHKNKSTIQSQKVVPLVRNSKIVDKDKFFSKKFQDIIISQKVIFYSQLFPYEFISLYKKLKNPILLSIEKVSVMGEKFVEVFFECIMDIKGIFDDIYEYNYSSIPFPLKYYDFFFEDLLSSLSYEVETRSRLKKALINYFRLRQVEIEKELNNNYALQKYNQQLLLSTSDIYLINRQVPALKNLEIRLQNSKEGKLVTKLSSQTIDKKLAGLSNKTFIDYFEKIFEYTFPEYFYKIFNMKSNFFTNLQSSKSPFYLLLCDDSEMIDYTIRDTIRNHKNLTEPYYVLDDNNLNNLNSLKRLNYDYLIVSGIDKVETSQQIQIWKQLKTLRNNFKSIILSGRKNKIAQYILKENDFEIVSIPTFEKLQHEKYRIFLYEFYQRKPFKKDINFIHLLFPFYLHKFDLFLDEVKSFETLIKTIDHLCKYFEISFILQPIYWFIFLKTEIIFTNEKENNYKNEPELKKEYRIEYKGSFWEINYGYVQPITLNDLEGFDYLFYLLKNNGKKMFAKDIYELFSEKKTDDDDAAFAAIKSAKIRALKNLKDIENKMGVSNAFSELLKDCLKEKKVTVKEDGRKYAYCSIDNLPEIKIIHRKKIEDMPIQ